ncbi:hypothetical protein [Bdellovibrio svalbardensis]|uniref:Uncharacterized protein n=1 Tax=Bdellovibrio svalbardensis TaxID=2972972 RepID=A0ABT6DKR8_9BACT|nr:hypothetical protein [Bdellovibrio svalbardensis]MDG0817465.1 hypothetical protein [Bdellovibrio svalbardensis]
MVRFSRLIIAFGLVMPSLSFADQLWDHSYTPQAELEVIYNQSQGDCPRTISFETNSANEIHMRAEGGYFSTMDAFGVMDGKDRSIGGFNTSFQVKNGSLLVTYVSGGSGWGTSNFASSKVKMTLSRDKASGLYSAELEQSRKESLIGFYHLTSSSSCKFKNTLIK